MSDGYPGNIGMAPVPLPQFRKRIDMGITEKSSRQVANWLLLGVVMTIIQIALGGITRLTGSGLSITQWDVITGALPPLNEQQWLNEFDKYKQTPQFHLLNFEFSLADFKFIFFWEWFHRLWGRLIGVVFAFGFIYFFIRRQFRKEMVIPFVTLFFFRGIARGYWLDYGSERTNRRCDLCKAYPFISSFYFCIGIIELYILVCAPVKDCGWANQ